LIVATTAQIASPAAVESPAARWHLLSLDAPTVAALWVWFISRAEHIRLPLAAAVAMALAVWILYAADRLLDTRDLHRSNADRIDEFETRHFFHHRHRRRFLFGIATAATMLAILLRSLDAVAIRLYLIEAALLFAWFVILHATRSAHRLPKEIAVGLFFSAAVFIPTVAREPALRLQLAPAAILFAAVCSLNCLFIYAWEHDRGISKARSSQAQEPHPTTRFAIAHLPAFAAIIGVASIALAIMQATPARPILIACLGSVACLLVLHSNRRSISRTNLRAAADLALLTPFLLMPFLR
jgi:hypothetical protein